MKSVVSIIVPCYNQAQYLDECLDSVLKQTYANWECIIVNDGSPDNTEEIASKWVEKDTRFIYLKKENGGLSSARNFGIEKAVGEFILPLDADDRISTRYIEQAIIAFKDDPSLKVVYCKAVKFGAQEGSWELPSFSLKNLAINNVIFCSGIYKKVEWLKIRGYDTKMIYGLEDWEFWISMLKNGGNVKQLDLIGFHYRIKEFSMLKSLTSEQKTFLFDYLSIKHADFFVAQIGSFQFLQGRFEAQKKHDTNKTNSKRFALHLFLKNFLGINYFKTQEG
jgi:glycosyltransferase involved in cell wall biosynthesis